MAANLGGGLRITAGNNRDDGVNPITTSKRVISALLRRFHDATQTNALDVTLWGTGTEVAIRELAGTIAKVTGYQGKLTFDPSKPDGAPRLARISERA